MSEEYDLRQSVENLGQLSPILKDKHGNVIDGLHRLQLYPDWPSITLEQIDTVEKLEAARLAVNTNRRVVSSSEIMMRVKLLAKAGLKPEQIMAMSGLSKTTVYKYFPDELKQDEKVRAGSLGGSASGQARNSGSSANQTVKTQETAQPRLECERCHVVTSDCKGWQSPNTKNQYILCSKCYERAELSPGAYETFFAYRDKSKTLFPPPSPQREAKPRDFDSWQHRKAAMSPQKSALELAVIQDLQNEGYPIETDVEFCTQKTIPDGYMRKANTLIYIDGAVHEGREDRDEQLRDRVQKLLGCQIITVKFDRDTKEERARVKAEIKQQLPC
jgi:very-short-patch-repair endonuclease